MSNQGLRGERVQSQHGRQPIHRFRRDRDVAGVDSCGGERQHRGVQERQRCRTYHKDEELPFQEMFKFNTE